MDRPLTVPEAAKVLDYSPDHLGRLLRAGTVKGELVGGRWLISRQELKRIKALQGRGGRLPRSVPKQQNT